jgi:endogenous inhibitor of DNA gyrase (YacG/DUF329 family)
MKCPTCGNTIKWEGNTYRPFCSERCKLLDLGAWVNEEYSVPGENTTVPEETESGDHDFVIDEDAAPNV